MHRRLHFVFPVITDRLRLFPGFYGKCQVDQVGFMYTELTARCIILIWCFVIISKDGVNAAQF